jgi:hypothetical protein
MKPIDLATGLAAALAAAAVSGEPTHEHPAPERLGTVQFGTSCAAGVQQDFERAVALLHSFAYRVAAQAFQAVAQRDPHCAMAHRGIAMSLYHQLWSPPAAAEMERGRKEIGEARRLGAQSERERQFIAAAAAYFGADEHATPAARAQGYLDAMASVAGHYPQDTEAQVFYALALLATAPPTDRTHSNQKRAAAILEPVFQASVGQGLRAMPTGRRRSRCWARRRAPGAPPRPAGPRRLSGC